MTKWKIYNEDAVEWAKNYQKGKFHALLCDAPYHLTSIVKRFGKKNSAPAQFGTDGVFSRSSKGFMGQQWDGGDLAFRPETWEAFGEVLYPGAFGMAFSASRNWHRMAVAIEDAGFILHPTIFLWAYGQGFPKATSISKQIEKGKVIGFRKANVGMVGNSYARGNGKTGNVNIIEYETVTGTMWEGHRYGLQALKPAVEPIICLSYDTEILTSQGWKNVETLSEDDLVANWWNKNSEITFEIIKSKIVSEELESIIHIQNRDTDQLITRHHRVYHKPITGRHKKASNEWQDSLAKDLPYNFKLPLSGYQDGEGIGGNLYASLLGWIWTEGTYENIDVRGRTGITITQSSVNQEKVNEIEKLLEDIGFPYKHYAYPRTYKNRKYVQHQFRVSGEFARAIRQDLPNKHLTYDLIFRMSIEEKQEFIRTSLLGDGWKDSSGSWHLAQDDRCDNNIFHTLLSLVGKSGTVSDGYVSIKQSGITEIRGARNQKIDESYRGIVWCVETNSRAFLARRNGKIFVTGNCFQKPYEGKPLDNIMETGAGALNIDASRIPLTNGDEYVINTFDDGAKPFGNGAGHKFTSRKIRTGSGKGKIGNDYGWSRTEREGKNWEGSEKGRWPSNLLLTEESAEKLDEQTGTLTSGKPSGKKTADNRIFGKYKNEDIDVTGFGDSGGASRFFYCVQEQLDENDPVYYCGKVSPKERQAGLDEKNNHPTLKPISLIKYLATLLLPPVEYAPRRIFIPFSGVASEMIGAGLAGWEHVVGVEFDTENGYVDIAEKRLQHWLKE